MMIICVSPPAYLIFVRLGGWLSCRQNRTAEPHRTKPTDKLDGQDLRY
jgi:hypothetical protein